MSIYFLENPSTGAVYELDATKEIVYSERGTLTSNIVESGSELSDHYINNPVSFNLEGVISDTKSSGSSNPNTRSTRDFLEGLRSIKRNKVPFILYYGEKVGSFKNCFFETLDITQNSTHGNVQETDSFEIRAVIKQVRLGNSASIVPSRDIIAQDSYQDKTQGSGSTKDTSREELTKIEYLTKKHTDLENQLSEVLNGP